MSRGRLALLAATTAYVVVLACAALLLPERVPAHFDGSGRVDEYAARGSVLVFWALVGVVVLLGLPVVGRLATAGDGTWVNMPQRSKEHWFAPERRAEFRVRFQDDMEGFAALTALLLVVMLALTTWVGRTGRGGLPWWVLVLVMGLYLVATAVWTVRLLRKYRPPPGA